MSIATYTSRYRMVAIMAVAALSIGLGAVTVSMRTSTPDGSPIATTRAPAFWGPVWSAIMRAVVTFSSHAVKRAAIDRISQATVKAIINEGRVVNVSSGVTRIRRGNIEVRINTRTRNVITIFKLSGGGGGGGGA